MQNEKRRSPPESIISLGMWYCCIVNIIAFYVRIRTANPAEICESSKGLYGAPDILWPVVFKIIKLQYAVGIVQ